MENKDSVELWIKTSGNVCKTIKLAMERHDDKSIVKMLELFRNATKQLQKLIQMSEKTKFTA